MSVDRPVSIAVYFTLIVDWMSDGIEQTAGDVFAYGDLDRRSERLTYESSCKTFRSIEGNASYDTVTSLLKDFNIYVIITLYNILFGKNSIIGSN